MQNITDSITNSITKKGALLQVYSPSMGRYAFLYKLGLVAIGVLTLIVSSYISIPLRPIPITMQTYVVAVIGLTYGWALGGTTIVSFIMLGALGVPVFSGGVSGIFFKMATGGYVIGFLLAVLLLGYLSQQRGWDKSHIKSIFAVCLASMLIYACGLTWLRVMVPGLDSLQKLFAVGLYPFIAGDIFKVALAGVTAPILWRLIGRKTQGAKEIE